MPPAVETPREGTARDAAPDERTGHVYIRAGTDLEIPSGFIRDNVAINDVIGLGIGVDAALGVGLSRHAEIDIAGNYAFMESAGRCPTCTGNAGAIGLGFLYHLAEGTALDPYARLGVAYRTASYASGVGAPASLVPGRFHGIDFMDLRLGATFFPVPSFGLGPFLAANVGTYVARPAASDGSSGAGRAYAFFQLGLSFELDPVRFAAKKSRTKTANLSVPSPFASPSPLGAELGPAGVPSF